MQLEEYKENIYKRYYEERAWEQKIRRLGQYSYIAMLFLNLLTFCYTRYDRKRIRKNMENTISSNVFQTLCYYCIECSFRESRNNSSRPGAGRHALNS